MKKAGKLCPQTHVINEHFDRKFPLTLFFSTAMAAAMAAYLWLYEGISPPDPLTGVMRWLAVGACAFLAATAVYSLWLRVSVDETGVSVHQLLGGSTFLGWKDIRTAAAVHLSTGFGEQSFIILSSKEPEQVLTRPALLWHKGLRLQEHVRIPYSTVRRAAVEHHLRMRLPDIGF